jgi:WD40 repeat protein
MNLSRFAAVFSLFLVLDTAIAIAQPKLPPPPLPPAGPKGSPIITPSASGKLPESARMRLGTDLFRDPNYISAASLSPDGKLLAICGGSTIVRFLDVATGKEDHRITIREPINTQQLFWTKDGKQLVTRGYQGINVWDAKDGKLIKQAQSPNRDGRDGAIHMSDDGKFVAIGNQYDNGVVKIVDLTTGTFTTTVKPIQNSTVNGALSPKGELVATWGMHYNRGNGKPEDEALVPRTIQLWDTKEGKEKLSLVSDIFQIMCVRFSPDGAKVAASGNGVIQMWDVASGKLERRFAGRTGQGVHLLFSPDGKFLAAAGQDGCVQVWDTASGKRAGICDGIANNVNSQGLLYRPDGQLMAWAVNVNAIDIWEVPSGKRLTPTGGHTAAVNSIQFSPDNRTLISCGNDGRMLKWDLATGKELEPFELKESEAKKKMYGYPRGYMGPSHFSPNGKYLVASGSNGSGAAVWDVESGLELFAMTSAGGYVDRSGIIAFSPDSSKLMAMNRYYGQNQNFPIPVWDMETGLPLPSLKGLRSEQFSSAAFSTDGSILTACSYYYPPNGNQIAEACSWDLNTGKILSRVQLPNMQFQVVQFLDHRLFVPFCAYSNNQKQKIYDAVTGGEVRTLEGSENYNGAMAVALSPDRRLMAFGAQSNRYSPDGRMLPSKIIVWEVASGSIRQELSGVEGTITALAFSRDGKTLASGGSDTTITLWDMSPKPEKIDALKPGDLDEMWRSLDGLNAKKADETMRKLIARPTESIPFLKEQLKPAVGMKADAAQIAKLIGDLDSGRYVVREGAMRDLERLGGHARDAVQQALKKPGLTPEMRERLEKLTDKINKPDTGAEWIKPLRGVEVLERIGSPEAIEHLKQLAAGGDAPPTRVAKEALLRLGAK